MTKLRSPVHFRVGTHSLPIEQNRIGMLKEGNALPKGAKTLGRCTFCFGAAVGDERHCALDCPPFEDLREQLAEIFQDSHDAMRSVM